MFCASSYNGFGLEFAHYNSDKKTSVVMCHNLLPKQKSFVFTSIRLLVLFSY